MTQNRRIVLNTSASYIRSLFSVACGIFSARWVLQALGQEDFGLFGLVGSMVIFVSFLSIQSSGAISRYYAYSLGKAKVAESGEDALDECRAWFSVALLIHVVSPLVLVFVGWPIGEWAIIARHLNIPDGKIVSCLWLWRFVCMGAFISILNVPFQAMFIAKQYIVELTVYSFAQTVVKTLFIYYMACNPGDWLVRYGLAMLIISVIPQIVICLRALWLFPECRFRSAATCQLWRIRQLMNYAFWTGVGGIGYLASHQCMSIIINNSFGAKATGAFSVSQTVAGEAGALSGALQGAFQPAITTVCGSGNMRKTREMALQMCKFATLMTMVFAVVIALEIEQILVIWLKDPPKHTAEMCISTLTFITVEKLSYGHIAAVNANGRIAGFQLLRGIARVLVIPIAVTFIVATKDAGVSTWSLPLSAVIVVGCDVIMARRMVGIRIDTWIKEVVVPICLTCIGAVLAGWLLRNALVPSLFRIVVMMTVELVMMGVFSFWFVFNSREKELIVSKVYHVFRRR